METIESTTPFVAIHPGEMITDEIKSRGMKQKELAALTGIPASNLNDILKGKRDINAELACLIGNALDIPAEMLMRLQSNYELDKATISERVANQAKALAIWKALDNWVSKKFLKKVGIIKGNVVEDVAAIFSMFMVTSIDELICKFTADTCCQALYKKSEKLETSAVDLFTWRHYCFHLAKITPQSIRYDKASIGVLIEKVKTITLENHNVMPRLTEAFSEAGIRLMEVPKYGQVPVDGLAFWKDDNPTIVLTLRKKNIDNVVFTILHELGHVEKHLHQGSEGAIDTEGMSQTEKEIEANAFAEDHLVPRKEWLAFMRKARQSPYKIKDMVDALSLKYGVNPQVYFGRCLYEMSFYKIKDPYVTTIN